MNEPIIRAHAAPWRNCIEILIASSDRKSRVTNLVLEPIENIAEMPEPSMRISLQAAQTMMDDLWNAGIRPTEGAGSAGAMRAVERHLEDMRTLVFKSQPTQQ